MLRQLSKLIRHAGLTVHEAFVYKITQMATAVSFLLEPATAKGIGKVWKNALGGEAGMKGMKAEALETMKTVSVETRYETIRG